MNHDSVPLVIFETGKEAVKHGPGGAVWEDDESHLFVMLPGTGRHLDAIAVTRDQQRAQAESRVWLLTGERSKPTLHPSLHVPGCWHGWLRDGQLISC